MSRFRVGIQLHPQQTSYEQMRAAWCAADELQVDSIWIWDHFFPLYGDPHGAHFEAYTLLAAAASDTSHAQLGALVSANSYRNPSLLADMARTIDHISDGRFVLGLGAGWFERDYEEYGFDFGTAAGRLRQLSHDLPVIMDRLGRLEPPPRGRLPILVGGGGEKVTLRLVAEHADAWNTFGPPDNFARKNAVLDDWCARIGRNPRQIERTVAINPEEAPNWREYVDLGADHVIVSAGPPFDLDPVKLLLDAARS
jgi:probable F420-dependent oxidoreductase